MKFVELSEINEKGKYVEVDHGIISCYEDFQKIGEYETCLHEPGENEAFIDGIKEGEVFYTIRLDKDGCFDVKTQAEAEIISRLVRIENLLKGRKWI